MSTGLTPGPMDVEHLALIRANVVTFMRYVAEKYAQNPGRLLDIAPQVHEGAAPFFKPFITIETLDIDPAANSTYTADITRTNHAIPEGYFNYIVCTEVLEHTLNPFGATDELYRLLATEGYAFISVPFNFRIHGPLPDCWRFTEHGLRALFKRFTLIELNGLETPDRPLMPVHYTVVVQKPA
jgi:hypothetical protein